MKNVSKQFEFLGYVIWIDWNNEYSMISEDGTITKKEILYIRTMIDHTMAKPLLLINCAKLAITVGLIKNRKNYLKGA